MRLLSSIFLTLALLVSTQVYAFDVQKANCPAAYNELENKFWTKLIEDATKGTEDKLDSIIVRCAVVNPPITVEEFKSLSMAGSIFLQYPDVVIPWTLYGDGGIFIVRGRITESRQIEFVKMMYYANGNLVISTALISVNIGRLGDAT
jgi:hypothetical protein